MIGKKLLLAAVLIALLTACVPALENSNHSNILPTPQIPVNPDIPPSPDPGGKNTEALITQIVDGDTIEVSINGGIYRLRYIGIDSPEPTSTNNCMRDVARWATDKNRELVGGKKVSLEKDISETDKYGRLLRYVYIGGLMVNAELVRLGYAQAMPYPPDLKYQDLFSKLQEEAKLKKLVIWGACIPNPPPPEKGLYVGSTKSDKYHYPSCFWAKQISTSNEVWFASKEDAQSRGYVPCKVCKPPQ